MSRPVIIDTIGRDIPVTGDMIGAGLRIYQYKHCPYWNSDEELLVAVYRAMDARRREAEREGKK